MKKKYIRNFRSYSALCLVATSLKTTSTKKQLRVTICSKCHPFFTGAQKFVDTQGRIENLRKNISNHKI